MPAAIRPHDASSPPPATAEPHPSWWRGLHAFALELGASLDPSQLASAAMRHLPPLLDADLVALRLAAQREDRGWTRGPAGAALRTSAWDAVHQGLENDRSAADGVVRRAELGGGGAALWVRLRQTDGRSGVILAGWASDPAPDAAARMEAAAAHLAGAVARAEAHAALHEASLGRDRFFSALGHDLRTPITAIVGYGELLHDGIVGPLTPQQADMVERITQVAGELSQMVNDVLDLARLDAGRMAFHLETESVSALVDDAMSAIAPEVRRKGLDLQNRVPSSGLPAVRADVGRVRQILGNLLHNAVKFTESGTVAVAAGAEDRVAWIEVADTGPGLAAGTEDTVFDEFLEVAAGRRVRQHGRGLSLAISRRLARAMSGELVARNRAGAGAAFTLYLPRPPEEPEPPGG